MTTTTLTMNFYGERYELIPELGRYGNGRLAITLVDATDGEPFATVTVNIPNKYIAPDEVAVKDWDENERVVEVLVQAGWLVPTGATLPTGHVRAKLMRLGGPLTEALNS